MDDLELPINQLCTSVGGSRNIQRELMKMWGDECKLQWIQTLDHVVLTATPMRHHVDLGLL